MPQAHSTSGSGTRLFPSALVCSAPGCTNVVRESWDEVGRLCGRCAIEDDLFDRESRWSRVFPVVVPAASGAPDSSGC